MPIATNPSTGETVYLTKDGAWEKAQTAVNPQTKEMLAFDGAEWKPVKTQSKGVLSYVDDAVRSIANGITFGYADELAAKGNELLGSGTYEQNIAQERARNEQIPTAISLPGEIAGAVGATIAAAPVAGLAGATRLGQAAARLPQTLRYGALGGAEGALAGSGNAVEGERLGGAITGAAIGAPIGAAAPYAVRGAANLASGVRNAVSPEANVAADLARAITRDEAAPFNLAQRTQQIAQNLAQRAQQIARDRPGVATLADAGGENVRGLVERVAQTPGGGRALVVPALTTRQQGQAARISNDLRSLTGTNRSAVQAVRETMEGRANAAQPLYRQAYEQFDTPINTPELQRLLSADEVSRAVQNATVKARGRSISEGFSGGFNANMQLTDAGVRRTVGPDRRVTFPNLQLWDYAKRELDDMAGAAANAGRNNEANYIRALARQLRTELDNVTTDPQTGQSVYRAARDAWSGPSAYLDAIEQGRGIMSRNVSAEEMTAAFRDLGGAEQAAFREGAISSIISRIGNDGARLGDMTKYLRSPEMRAKIAAIMPNQQSAEAWARRLDFEVGASELTGRALGNSATARRLAEKQDAENLVGDLVMDAISGAGGVSLLRRAVSAGPKWLRDTLRARADRELGDVLTNPQRMQDLPRILQRVNAGAIPRPRERTNAAVTVGGAETFNQ